jgi:hypothetical protein
MSDFTNLLLDRAEQIANQAKARGGSLTATEKAEVNDLIKRAGEIKATEELRAQYDAADPAPSYAVPTAGAKAGGSFAESIIAGLSRAVDPHTGKLDVKSGPSAEVSGYAALGAKAPTLPNPTVINPTPGAITAAGRDQRFLWPNLDIRSAVGFTAVSDYKQTARTVTGDVERSPVATTDKASLGVTLEHVVTALRQFAVVVDGVPNEMLENMDNLRTFLDTEGRFQVEKAIDSHVLSQIVAASPPFGNTGTGLVEQVRNGVTAMRAEGANPNLLVLNAADAAALDLTADAGGYIFPLKDTGASPLWGLRVIERAGTTPPYLIDTNMVGSLYLGGMSFDLDPFTGFRKNLTDLRIEVNGLMFVRNAKGARRVAAS